MLVLFREDGAVHSLSFHAGRISFVKQMDAGDKKFLVYKGTNNRLGKRFVLFGLDNHLNTLLPPFQLNHEAFVRPRYYSFTSMPQEGSFRIEGDELIQSPPRGEPLRIDMRTGVPQDLQHRDGLNEEQWLQRQNELLQAMEVASRMARAGQVTNAARTMEVEPEISGHIRLYLDLVVRQGRWPEAVQTLFERSDPAARVSEVSRDFVIGALLAGRPEDIRSLISHVGSSTCSIYGRAVMALHQNRPDEAVELLNQKRFSRQIAELAFLLALSRVLPETLDMAMIESLLDTAESGKGTGQALSFLPLRAYLESFGGSVQTSWQDVEDALADHHEAGRDNMVDLYLIPWGEAFAVRAALARGDSEGWERHRDIALTALGAGPYVDAIMNK